MSDKEKAQEATHEAVKPKSVTYSYYIRGVKFDTIEEYVAIRKHQNPAEFSGVDKHIEQTNALQTEYATKASKIQHLWETIPPIEPKEAFKKYASNAQQLMTVMSIMGPEKTFKALDSEVFDTQTVIKTQKRTFLKDPNKLNFGSTKTEKSPSLSSELFETKEVTYEDKYILHKINKKNFGENSGLESDVFVLQVECPSTHQHYFIFVDGNEPQCKDAIGAVAWTMVKDDGTCLTKEEYMKLQAEA